MKRPHWLKALGLIVIPGTAINLTGCSSEVKSDSTSLVFIAMMVCIGGYVLAALSKTKTRPWGFGFLASAIVLLVCLSFGWRPQSVADSAPTPAPSPSDNTEDQDTFVVTSPPSRATGVRRNTVASSSPSNATAPEEKIVAHQVTGSFDLVVGHSHHVQEASTDRDDALALIQAREGHSVDGSPPAARIEELYGHEGYRHFGNDNEPAPPMCKVDDQDPVDVDDDVQNGGLNMFQPKSPVSCTTSDGTTLYVTGWEI